MTGVRVVMVAPGAATLTRQEVAQAADLAAIRFAERPTLVAARDAESIQQAYRHGDHVVLFTSGTTGRPRCLGYDGATFAAHVAAIAHGVGVSDAWQWVALPPAGYAFGMSIVATHRYTGVPVTFGASALREERPSRTPMAVYLLPGQIPELLSTDLSAESVGRVVIAGGRVSAAGVGAMLRRFPGAEITNMYGQAELGPRISLRHSVLADFREGDVGYPLPGVQVSIADADAKGVGRLLVRSEYAAAYVSTYPYTESFALPDEVDTGDLGFRSEDGAIVHYGRGDNIINVAGTKVDASYLQHMVDDLFAPVASRVGCRSSRLIGDSKPVIEMVMPTEGMLSAAEVRRVLSREIGSLAALIDIRLVSCLSSNESGK